MTLRIAMWSGPRNISTAMMRAWGSRLDCGVSDEPLYAHYLSKTGIPHPGFEEILSSQSTDWRHVVEALSGPAPGGEPIWYQKHMTHHMLPCIDRAWMKTLFHCFLIRSPAEVIASYSKTRDSISLQDIGFQEQADLYHYVRDVLGQPAPVIDSRDVLKNPKGMLLALCDAIGIPFDEGMLRWEPGPRSSDGVWAKYWYHSVEKSTGFMPLPESRSVCPDRYEPLRNEAESHYQVLFSNRIRC